MAVFAMAIFRLPLWQKKNIVFYKLMGTGKNGSFDLHPEWQQWSIMAAYDDNTKQPEGNNLKFLYGKFIAGWLKFFRTETATFILQPFQVHGKWDGKKVFKTGDAFRPADNEKVAILTRATIRFGAIKDFWQNVPAVSEQVLIAPGLLYTVGIGEIPLTRQATFSVWENKDAMAAFAYNRPEHMDVIKKTRERNWYSEEMFCRFTIKSVRGTIKGKNPVPGMT